MDLSSLNTYTTQTDAKCGSHSLVCSSQDLAGHATRELFMRKSQGTSSASQVKVAFARATNPDPWVSHTDKLTR